MFENRNFVEHNFASKDNQIITTQNVKFCGSNSDSDFLHTQLLGKVPKFALNEGA
jgi:hypothetical protein